MTDRALTVAEITQHKIDLRLACEEACRICGLEAASASLCNDTHNTRAWSELQRYLDDAIKKVKGGAIL